MNTYDLLGAILEESKKTNELLALMAGNGGAATTTSAGKTPAKRTAAKKPAATKEPEVTKAEANDAAIALKDAHGVAVVKEILKANGVAKLAEMTDAQAPGVHKDCLAKQAELDAGAEESEEDDI